jgi:hypothetical protein
MQRAIICTFLLVSVIACAAAQQKPTLDGNWWVTLRSGDRVQFVAGYIDCYANDFGDKNNTFPESWYTYAPRITRYYERQPASKNQSVAEVLFQVRSTHPPKPQKGGETWKEKHGLFNGEYWRQIGHDERTAFIQGYLACYGEHLKSCNQKFSLAASKYALDISHWFGIRGDDPAEIDPKRENIAIADVLYKFRDGYSPAPDAIR